MSTRCTIQVSDRHGTYTVYRHCDGYPGGTYGIVQGLKDVVASGYAWPLPRFETMDFAAAIIACWKTQGGGNIYCTSRHEDHTDTEYQYDVAYDGEHIRVSWNDIEDDDESSGEVRVTSPTIIA